MNNNSGKQKEARNNPKSNKGILSLPWLFKRQSPLHKIIIKQPTCVNWNPQKYHLFSLSPPLYKLPFSLLYVQSYGNLHSSLAYSPKIPSYTIPKSSLNLLGKLQQFENPLIPISEMDSVNTENLESMKKHKKFQFLNSLFHHSVLALLCTLFCSYPFWFPHLCSSMNHLAFVSLPNFNIPFFSNPKFLFIVGNAIIVFLVGESKLSNPPPSPATEIYSYNEGPDNEYVGKGQKNCEFSSQMEKKGEGKLGIKFLTEESVKNIEKQAEEREEEEEGGLETEELTKRVEDFIARVNRQRLVEARFEDCGRGWERRGWIEE